MTSKDIPDEIDPRVIGKRYLDTENDVSFTVIKANPPRVVIQFDDGRFCRRDRLNHEKYDELFPREKGTACVRLQRAGIDDGRGDERYLPLGDGRTIYDAKETCSGGNHRWSIHPDEIWPKANSLPQHPQYLYRRLVRCEKCGLSGETIYEYFGERPPWWCRGCEEIYSGEELLYLPADFMSPVCPECNSEYNSVEDFPL